MASAREQLNKALKGAGISTEKAKAISARTDAAKATKLVARMKARDKARKES
jgi:hypothetical protein